MADKQRAMQAECSPPNNRTEVDGIDSNATFKQATRSNDCNAKTSHLVNVVICFLDESKTVFQISQKALGKTLFYQVCESLNLIELDYFGLEYFDSSGIQYWVDLEKPIFKQLSLSLHNLSMNFAVKFYTSEPSKLEDELTRYLFALQIKKDLADGNLICSENIASLLSSYIIQAECGDYNTEEYSNHLYISKFKLIPQQDDEFEMKVMENHKKLIGLSPAEADLQLLEFAKKLDMYGIKLSPVKDHEGVPLNLSVINNGILIFQNHTKVNTFDWVKIRKLSFKRKHFFIKLHQEEFFGDVLEFVFQHRNECKNFWKKCIEQHSFFKCLEIKLKTRQKMRIFSRGSSFRYAGRTQQQISDYIKSNHNTRKQKPFQRSNSMKFNTLKSDDCLGYSSDVNDSKCQDNPDSISYATSCNTMRQMYKSCDTIDQESGLNYYSLHSIISLTTDHNCSLTNDKSKEYNLHAIKRKHFNRSALHCRYNTTYKRNMKNQFYLSVRINQKVGNKSRYVLVNQMPCIENYSFSDDSTNDPFVDYLRDYIKLKKHLLALSDSAIAQLVPSYERDKTCASLILRANFEHYFLKEFKLINFDLRYQNYVKAIANKHRLSEKVVNLKDLILHSNLESFQLF